MLYSSERGSSFRDWWLRSSYFVWNLLTEVLGFGVGLIWRQSSILFGKLKYDYKGNKLDNIGSGVIRHPFGFLKEPIPEYISVF